MSIKIGSYNFEGPYTSVNDLLDSSGVYSILGRSSDNERWSVVDIGETQRVRSRVSTHDRKRCWEGRGHRQLAAAAHYTGERDRLAIERELRLQYQPPCGKH